MAEDSAAEPENADSWWQTVLWGLFVLALGVGVYFYFTAKEAEGGRFRAAWPIVVTYELLGKWGVVGLFGVIGVALLVVGGLDFRKRKAEADV